MELTFVWKFCTTSISRGAAAEKWFVFPFFLLKFCSFWNMLEDNQLWAPRGGEWLLEGITCSLFLEAGSGLGDPLLIGQLTRGWLGTIVLSCIVLCAVHNVHTIVICAHHCAHYCAQCASCSPAHHPPIIPFTPCQPFPNHSTPSYPIPISFSS